MSPAELGAIGIIGGVIGYLLVFLVSWRRAPHQNISDDSGALKATSEAAEMAAKARLRAEAELVQKQSELEAMEGKFDAVLEKMRNLTLRLTFTLTNMESPKISDIVIEKLVPK